MTDERLLYLITRQMEIENILKYISMMQDSPQTRLSYKMLKEEYDDLCKRMIIEG